jgi:hypothetical protein
MANKQQSKHRFNGQNVFQTRNIKLKNCEENRLLVVPVDIIFYANPVFFVTQILGKEET